MCGLSLNLKIDDLISVNCGINRLFQIVWFCGVMLFVGLAYKEGERKLG